MASPLSTAKQSVNLATPVRGSRIRRDPPPVVKPIVAAIDSEEREARMVVVGVVSFALALVIITIGLSSVIGWSPSQYTVAL
jgi:hypothetical protein